MPAWYKLIEISATEKKVHASVYRSVLAIANQSEYHDTHKAYNIYEKVNVAKRFFPKRKLKIEKIHKIN